MPRLVQKMGQKPSENKLLAYQDVFSRKKASGAFYGAPGLCYGLVLRPDFVSQGVASRKSPYGSGCKVTFLRRKGNPKRAYLTVIPSETGLAFAAQECQTRGYAASRYEAVHCGIKNE